MADEPLAPAAQGEKPTPELSDKYPLGRDPLDVMRALRRWTRLIVYPAVTALIPFSHFLLGETWLSAIVSHAVGGYFVATLGIEFAFWYGWRLRKEAAYPIMLAMDLGATEDFAQACESAVRLLGGLLGAEKVVLTWRNQEDGSLTTVSTHGIPPEAVADATSLSWWQQNVKQAIDEREVIVAPVDRSHPWQSGSSGRTWVAYVPLLSLDKVVGLLILVGGQKASDLRDKMLLVPIGLTIGLTLENLRHTVELRRRTDEYVATTNLTGDIIARMDKHGMWTFLNDAACQFFGKPREELLGTDSRAFLHPDDLEPTAQAIRQTRSKRQPIGGLVNRQLTPMGTRVVEWNGYPLFDEDGQYTGIQITGRDITERQQMEEEREKLHAEMAERAITDSLTGLYNHAHFYQRLAEEIDRSKRYKRRFAVVMMDVDSFKQYNDSRGHQAGDDALRLLADCICTGIRHSDLAFRYGGDEFAAILLNADSARAQTVVNRINRHIAAGLKKMDPQAAAWLGLSAGVASYPEDATTVDELVQMADAALYNAKQLAWARGLTEEEQAIESPGYPQKLVHETQAGMLTTAASSLATVLHDLGVSEVAAALDLRAIAAVGAASEIKDRYMRGHQERASLWAAALAEDMGLPSEQVRNIRIAGLLHDIGKVSINDGILNKPGKLTEEEFAKVKRHAPLGAEIMLSEAEALQQLAAIVRYHHEHFDGTGYPDGLAGEQIPLEARIMSVVDVFDAMTHERSYRKALSREEAIAEIERGAGTQFDPAVVKAFLALAKRRSEEAAAPAQAASEDRRLASAKVAAGRKG
jgi:diguanylate cyclase (GGDEF)-like protein/PAS domain S-box-containing protein